MRDEWLSKFSPGQFIALNEVFASAKSVWTSIDSTLDTAALPNEPDNCAGVTLNSYEPEYRDLL